MSKTDRIEEYLRNNIGAIITPRTVADNCSCTVQTVYNYIKAHPDQFAKFDHGKYIFRMSQTSNTSVTVQDNTVENTVETVTTYEHEW